MKIIPACDLLDGRIVRLVEGDYTRVQSYADITLQSMAETCLSYGIDRIHVVDLNEARGECTDVNEALVLSTLKKIAIKIQMGGGIRNPAKARQLLDSGIHKVIVGTAALTHPWLLVKMKEMIAPEQVILAADVLDGAIRYEGWKTSSAISPEDFVEKWMVHGYASYLVTNIKRDGTLKGVEASLYKDLLRRFPSIRLIASGGVASMEDIRILACAGVESVVVGKAIYEGRITLEEIAEWNHAG